MFIKTFISKFGFIDIKPCISITICFPLGNLVKQL